MTARTGRFICRAASPVLLAIMLLGATSAASAQEKATGEGIKVHGHWTIDIKNPDGSLASHHEFENALKIDGTVALSYLLAHRMTVVGWGVFLLSIDLREGLLLAEGNPPLLTNAANLTASAQVLDPQLGTAKLVLQGVVQAPSAISILQVNTELFTSFDNGPAAAHDFSGRTLPQAIDVQANQFVQVTVVFTYS